MLENLVTLLICGRILTVAIRDTPMERREVPRRAVAHPQPARLEGRQTFG